MKPPVGIGLGKPRDLTASKVARTTSWQAEDGWHASMTSGMVRVIFVGPYPSRVNAVCALRLYLRRK